MRAPEFWREDGMLPRLLTPASWAFDLGGRWRQATARPWRAPRPVICVGNLVVGGAGKTPVAVSLAAMLRAQGCKPAFLTRGYGGKLPGPLRVDPRHHSAEEVGDEAVLLSSTAPVWVSRHRPAGARAAIADGADVIVMDDGFQNPSLAKDLSVLVVDADYGLGNGRVLPAGPLRERPERGLRRADLVLLVAGPDGRRPALPRIPAGIPVLEARLVPDVKSLAMAGQRVVAFAGIGHPPKFFRTVRAIGADLVEARAFADHHHYRPEEIMALVDLAVKGDATLVTTVKDYVRLPEEARAMVDVVRVVLEFDAPDLMAQLLAQVVADG